jgi:uncharacterized membrane protein
MVLLASITWILGLLLMATGGVLSTIDWNRAQKSSGATQGFDTEAAGASEVLKGLAKLFEAIGKYPLGRFLIAIGFSLVVVGAIVTTVGAFAA